MRSNSCWTISILSVLGLVGSLPAPAAEPEEEAQVRPAPEIRAVDDGVSSAVRLGDAAKIPELQRATQRGLGGEERGIIIVGGKPVPMQARGGDGGFDSWSMGSTGDLALTGAWGVATPKASYVLEGLIDFEYTGAFSIDGVESSQFQPRVRARGEWHRGSGDATETLRLEGGLAGEYQARFKCDRDPWTAHAALCDLVTVQALRPTEPPMDWDQLYAENFGRPLGASKVSVKAAKEAESRLVKLEKGTRALQEGDVKLVEPGSLPPATATKEPPSHLTDAHVLPNQSSGKPKAGAPTLSEAVTQGALSPTRLDP